MEEAKAAQRHWLLKAEPDSRVVKGKDVKFSVDDFERVKTSPWDGVRNYEARNLMKEMRVGDKALFYHSNCKNPGIAAFAKVEKEAYPDHSSWDPSHLYYDPKSDPEKPKWFMVDLAFSSRTENFVPLAILRFLSSRASFGDVPQELKYIGEQGLNAIKGMDLVSRGRLSVQRVKEEAWDIIVSMAEKGGWEGVDTMKQKASSPVKRKRRQDVENEARTMSSPLTSIGSNDGVVEDETRESEQDDEARAKKKSAVRRPAKKAKRNLKRKDSEDGDVDDTDFRPRKSTRTSKRRGKSNVGVEN